MNRDSRKVSSSARRLGRRPSFSTRVSSAVRDLWRSVIGFIAAGSQRFTIMFIPHSEKRVVNLQINAYAMLFVALAAAVVVGWFVYLATVYTGTERLAGDTGAKLRNTEMSLEEVRQEVVSFLQVYDEFERALTGTLERLDIRTASGGDTPVSGGDLASILNLEPVRDGEMREIRDLQRVVASLRASMEPLAEVSEVLDLHKQLLSDIPNHWPVQYGAGYVTMEFGPNIHPVRGVWYMHKGIQIAYYSGTPIVAAANGVVTRAGFDGPGGNGGSVEINHNYGFRTRYGHLADINVNEGEQVVQGQRIGTMGTTGLSTGAHLNFQIWIGTENIDPIYFLRLSRPDLTRRTRNRL